MWGGGIYCDNLHKAIAKFNPGIKGKELIKLEKDIILCYLEYGATPDEYFLLGFSKQTSEQRASFVTDRIKDEECLRTASLEMFNKELTDKYNFYLRNTAFFHRKTILVACAEDFSKFSEFIRESGQVFAKPIDGSYGSGAHIIKDSDENKIRKEFDRLLTSGKWIIEELIVQAPEMSAWNKSSVNTVRIPSVLTEDGKSVVIGPFFRTGRSGHVIDNAGGGGILAAIDPNTGRLISDGFSEDNHYHECHPDSGKKYKGWVIPEWKKLLDLAEKVHKNMPGHKYLAFDFAYTPQGWVLIEGNWGQFLWQYATKKGLKKQFLELMRK